MVVITTLERVAESRDLSAFQSDANMSFRVAEVADAVAAERAAAVRNRVAPSPLRRAEQDRRRALSDAQLTSLAAAGGRENTGQDVVGRTDAVRRQLFALRPQLSGLTDAQAQEGLNQIVDSLMSLERDLLSGSPTSNAATGVYAYLSIRAAVEFADRERLEFWSLLRSQRRDPIRAGAARRWADLEAAQIKVFRSTALSSTAANLDGVLFSSDGIAVRRLRRTLETTLPRTAAPVVAERWWEQSSGRLEGMRGIALESRGTLSRTVSTRLSEATRTLNLTVGLSTLALLGVFALGLLLRRSIARNLSQLAHGAHALSAGDLTSYIDSSGHDEIAEVGAAFQGIHRTNRRLVDELQGMNTAIARGELDHRADAVTFRGAWAEVLDGMNCTMTEVARLHHAAELEVVRQRALGVVGRQIVSGIALPDAFALCGALISDHLRALRGEFYEYDGRDWSRSLLVGWPASPIEPHDGGGDLKPAPSQRDDTTVALTRVLGRTDAPAAALVVEFDDQGAPTPGDLLFVDGIARLLSEALHRRRSEDDMRYRALHDPLTGLPNRTMFLEHLASALKRGTRANETVAVLFLDLDAFKIVNDSLGHAVGDELLVGVSRRLLDVVRGGDLVARLGGDEFVVVTERLTEGGEAQALADRLLASLRDPFMLGERKIYTTVSIGIACSEPGRSVSGDALLQQADTAMYRAKRNGGGQAEPFDDELRTTVVRRMDLEHRLRSAIDRQDLHVAFQPIVALASKDVVGFEALARWSDAEIGDVSPAEFIPIAEETQLISELGFGILRQSCEQFSEYQRASEPGASPLRFAVNVSVRQLQQPGFVDRLLTIRDEFGLQEGSLSLELTESVLLDDSPVVRAALTQLAASGLSIAIDDFGTGYSSFALLTQLPIATLKIDRSLIAPLLTAPEHRAVVGAIIDMSHHLGLKVVAEGIEELEQATALTAMGCDFGQGWLFGRPAPLPRQVEPGTIGL